MRVSKRVEQLLLLRRELGVRDQPVALELLQDQQGLAGGHFRRVQFGQDLGALLGGLLRRYGAVAKNLMDQTQTLGDPLR